MSVKNGDLPAMPVDMTNPRFVDYVNFATSKGERECVKALLGLTKREQFAMVAMQGLLVNMGRNGFDNVSVIAAESVMAADALLAELECTK